MKEFHVLNLGAGVQSTALYLMFMRGIVTPQLDAAIFADTQDEPAEVYRHLTWLESLGGPRIIRTSIGKLSEDLIKGINSTGQRWISIPAFTSGEVEGEEGRLRRQCSKEYKIIPIQQSIRRDVLGLKAGKRVPKGVMVHQYFGISLDESGRSARIQRAKRPCEIDAALRSPAVTQNRKRKNNNPMYLHRSLQPLVQIDLDNQVAKPQQSWIGFSRECMGGCGI